MDGGGGGYRVEAERWLMIAEKLLTARDFQGAKSFAIRARESDPRLMEFAEQIIAVSDTVLAGELRISYGGGESYDYYAILQVPRLTQSMDLIASQYRKLALLLNPNRNHLVYADQSFKLVSEAWLVFSNPSKKAMYDQAMQLSQLGGFEQHPPIQHGQFQEGSPPSRNVAHPFVTEPARPVVDQHRSNPSPTQSTNPELTRSSQRTPTKAKATDSSGKSSANLTPAATRAEPQVPSFWTTCPYCYILYEYPKMYEELAVRCQGCKRAFQAVVIPPPPENAIKDGYFNCWAYFPLGCKGFDKSGGGSGAGWTPFSPMFATPLQIGGKKTKGAKVIYKDDDYIDLSDSNDSDSDSDEEWSKAKEKKGKGTSNKTARKSQNERGKKGTATNLEVGGKEKVVARGEGTSGKRKVAGKLDLNVMFSNEVDEAVPGVSEGNGAAHGQQVHEDNIEGIGFFEGLDEFLSTLPILSVVGDDKVKHS